MKVLNEQEMMDMLQYVDDLRLVKLDATGEKVCLDETETFQLCIPTGAGEQFYTLQDEGLISLAEEIGIKKKLVAALCEDSDSKQVLLSLLNMFVGKTCFSVFIDKDIVVAALPEDFQRYSLKDELSSMLMNLREGNRRWQRFLFVEPVLDLFDGFEAGIVPEDGHEYISRDGEVIIPSECGEIPAGTESYASGAFVRLAIVKNKKPEVQGFTYMPMSDMAWLSERVLTRKPKEKSSLDNWLADKFRVLVSNDDMLDLAAVRERSTESVEKTKHDRFIRSVLKVSHVKMDDMDSLLECVSMMDVARKIMGIAVTCEGMKMRKGMEGAGHLINHGRICSSCEQEVLPEEE